MLVLVSDDEDTAGPLFGLFGAYRCSQNIPDVIAASMGGLDLRFFTSRTCKQATTRYDMSYSVMLTT